MNAGVWKSSNGSTSPSGLMDGLKSLKVRIVHDSRIIGAPVEDGRTSFDNKVIEPNNVVVTGAVYMLDTNASQTLSDIKKMARSRDWDVYSASDGISLVNNLILKTATTERVADKFDLVNVELVFVERMLVQSETSSGSPYGDAQSGSASPSNPECRDSVSAGYVAGQTI